MKRAILLQIDEITAKKGRILKDFSLKATSEFNRLWKDRADTQIPHSPSDPAWCEPQAPLDDAFIYLSCTAQQYVCNQYACKYITNSCRVASDID